MGERLELWDFLRQNFTLHPWFVTGDFNTISKEEDKVGGLPINIRAANEYLHCMDGIGVSELKSIGSKFTWWNKRSGDGTIFERIDKVCLNNAGANLFTNVTLEHLSKTNSDHSPLLLTLKSEIDNNPRRFIFQKFWTKHSEFLKVVRMNWLLFKKGNALYSLANNLKNLKKALIVWNKCTFGNIFQEVIDAEDESLRVEKLFEDDPSPANRIVLMEAKAKLNYRVKIEEGFWAQKANLKWAKEGDANTKNFHGVVRKRRNKSTITSISNSQGAILTGKKEIQDEAVSFFRSLLAANTIPQSYVYKSLECVSRVITEEVNVHVTEDPTYEEVKNAIWELNKNSAPDIDGFNGHFFTVSWDIISQDIFQAVLQFFSGATLPKAMTTTVIPLIPKKNDPDSFADFRPISLCTFFNKVISKIMSTRLSDILPIIISENQCGFVKKRDIIDNILLSQEFISNLDNKSSGSSIAIKLDMKKAYDKISWHFLVSTLRKMGFLEIWIDRVWRLISDNGVTVMVNGASSGFFSPTNGLRQGDPLSSSLFIICSEVLGKSHALFGNSSTMLCL